MNGFHTFMSLGVPAGRMFGIRIRIHFLFFLYIIFEMIRWWDIGVVFAMSMLAGVYVCILLHEFGHALSARWCGGDADEILIWPLGGLAYCRPPFNPTPHLITTLGGPFVTLVIWAVLTPVGSLLAPAEPLLTSDFHWWSWQYIKALAAANGFLLLFNCVPAFPMDGGRAFRDTLWHFMPIQKANLIAGTVGIFASIALIWWGFRTQEQMFVFIGIYTIFASLQERVSQEYTELWEVEPWSLREKLASRGEHRRIVKMARARDKEEGKRPRYQAKMVPRLEVREDRRAVEKVDAILEKISRSGMESLTPEEKRELERASTELKRQDG